MRSLRSVVVAVLLISSSLLWAKETIRGYDELYDESGRLRPQYEEFYANWSRMTERQKENFLRRSREDFRGDNALDALPRVMTGAEYDQVLKPGVDQRARALRAFLEDHYSGRKAYARSGVLPKDAIERIISRSIESGWEGLVKPEHIAFLYGPDIIRDEKGVFRVIEDNPGFIGGVGDLRLAYEKILEHYGKNPDKAPFRSPEEFYRAVSESYKKRAAKFGGKAVIYMTKPYSDNEDIRIQRIFREYGIETVTNESAKRLLVRADGVYLQHSQSRGVPLEKVGFVMMIGEHSWLDPSHPQAKIKAAAAELEAHLEEADLTPRLRERMESMLAKIRDNPESVRMVDVSNLLDQSSLANGLRDRMEAAEDARGLIRASLENKVGTNYSPGVDFIGDKEFYVFVEDMIRFYLNEEPILRNIPTERFADGRTGRLNEELFNRIFSNLSSWVIKKVDGRGGDAVWVGPKVKPEEIPALKERILKQPEMFIVQAFTPLSRMGENIVDMRVISDVSHNEIIVTDTPWGRGLPMNGNGKVNLSDKGREITVLVRGERAPLCRWMFKF
jgi:uncharacterized circularly permuted ATP-grasp superfamily protein